jgi:uncharacterized membrane protein
MGIESHRKSALKAVSWRVVGTIDTFLISWLISGSIHLGSAIAATEVVTKVVLYYFHERAWSRVN